jgi:hypothetical protein
LGEGRSSKVLKFKRKLGATDYADLRGLRFFLPQPAYASTFAKATADKKATAVRKNAERFILNLVT